MKEYYKVTNVLEYLEGSAKRFPDKIAFADEKETLTFSQLRDEAMGIGSALKQFDLHKDPVVILMDARHVPNLKATMGILYAGCFYIPLDPASPAERLQIIFEKLEPALVICDEKAQAAKEALGGTYRFVDYETLTDTAIDEDYLESVRAESNFFDRLFIMYTSGSTGVPKGVVHTHGQMIDYTEFTYRRYPFDEHTVFGNQSPFFYANCLLDIYPPLAVGATVYVLSASLLSFPKKMVEELQANKITELCMTPSSFNAIAEAGVLEPGCLPDLEFILPSGETINGKVMKQWESAAPKAGRFWNFYGSTELLSASLYKVDRDYGDDENVPSGIPYRCTHILIVDEDGKELPRGEKGEMLIHNPWMFSGYYKDDARNEASFVDDPLKQGYHELFFRTGDMGYLNEKGELVVVGRKDNMIKHNGYRMELGEVEFAAKGIRGTHDCCCVHDKESGRIFLFYTGEIEEKALRSELKSKLPKYAMPEKVVHLDSIPYSANVKADRLALARMIPELGD
ncbi:MAG: AMP-binding protein [Parasporobacterium sp.]|nr:AMP-binding protein [Parasporobacterium sp.]